jgi:hypothetical protein
MHGASAKVSVREVQADRRIRFSREGCDPARPITAGFQFIPHQNGTTYLARSQPHPAVDTLPQQVGVADVAGVLLDHVDQHLPH